MKRIQYLKYGEPEELFLADVDQPEPGPGQIRVEVRAASVNPMDWKIRRGEMKLMSGSQFPRGLGHDFSGVVDAVGPGVERFRTGDEVFGAASIRRADAFADYVISDTGALALKPPNVTFEQAATLTVFGSAAWIGLIAKAKLRAGQSVLITGCLGGVGRSAVQIARMQGAIVTGTCRASGREEAQALEVSEVIDYRAFDVGSYSQRFDVVFDTAGALLLRQCGTNAQNGRRVPAHRSHACQENRMPASIATSHRDCPSNRTELCRHCRSGRKRHAFPGDRVRRAAVRSDPGHRRARRDAGSEGKTCDRSRAVGCEKPSTT